ncbi:MAG: caspase family protein [Cyanobacteria bacterium J06638_20]
MALTRRAFLERTGWAIAALGMSQSSFFAFADRHQQALAESARGCRALLIGINQYPESVCDFAPIKGSALAGCLTDVELQTELLLSRFGFAPSEILALTDAQATRDGIIDAFQEHLIESTRSSDKILFHFSGLGSRVRSLPPITDAADATTTEEPNIGQDLSTLVPVDGILPTEDKPILRDLSLDDLRTLTQALPTANITTVLDVAFANQGTVLQGNYRIRSRPSIPMGQIQSPNALTEMRSQTQGNGELAGVTLFATEPHQPALEGHWSGFSAGFFTYALTQYLWEMMPPQKLKVVFPKAVNRVYQLVGGAQTPVLKQERNPESVYSLKPEQPASEGVVKQVTDDGLLQIWLGGLPAQVLACYGSGAKLRTSVAGQPVELVGRSRSGLMLKAAIAADFDVAANTLVDKPVYEAVRLIPDNLNLTIALDPNLERIERVDATSAFAAAKVNVVAAGEQAADLVFGKASLATVTAALNQVGLAAAGSAPNSYGLFYPPYVAVPGTVAAGDEAVKTAVNRLISELPRLLAIKYLQLTENATSSKLSLRATLKTAESNPQIIARVSTYTAMTGKDIKQLDVGVPDVATATSLECQIQNLGEVPLHLLWVLLPEANRPISISMLPGDNQETSDAAIAPGDTFTFPQAAFGSGLVEIFLVASPKPFPQTASLIANQQINGRNSDPVEVSLQRVQTILQDLSTPNSASDAYALNVQDWATLRLRYRIT